MELFLKSFRAAAWYLPATREDGAEYESYEHAYRGHNVQFENLYDKDADGLRKHLSEQQFAMLKSTLSRKEASDQLTPGRYPYGNKDGSACHPAGDAGRDLATDWFNLAKALSQYQRAPPGEP
ncbi:MAG: hypothetical protein ACJA1E_000638 [Paracoccaceae bacterium]|jgi:hypothetical protein